MMGKKRDKAIEIGHKAIEQYMTLIAQVDALASPMVQMMIEPKVLMKEALELSDELDSLRGDTDD